MVAHSNHTDVLRLTHLGISTWGMCLQVLFKRKKLKMRLFPFSNIVNLKSKKISHRQNVSTIFCSVLSCFHSAFSWLPKANLQAWPSHHAEWHPGGPLPRAWDYQVWGVSAGAVTSLFLQGNLVLPRSGSACWRCPLSPGAETPWRVSNLSPTPSDYSYAFAATPPFFAVLSSH